MSIHRYCILALIARALLRFLQTFKRSAVTCEVFWEPGTANMSCGRGSLIEYPQCSRLRCYPRLRNRVFITFRPSWFYQKLIDNLTVRLVQSAVKVRLARTQYKGERRSNPGKTDAIYIRTARDTRMCDPSSSREKGSRSKIDIKR